MEDSYVLCIDPAPQSCLGDENRMKQLDVDCRLSSESGLEHDRASMSPGYIKGKTAESRMRPTRRVALGDEGPGDGVGIDAGDGDGEGQLRPRSF